MSAPDMGSMAVTNALNPPETSTSDVPNQIPTPDAAPTPPTAPDPAVQAANAPAPPPSAKPSLWRGVLSGALQGLAAGASVNTHGMGAGGAFAAGAGAGVNQVINNVPRQNAEMDQAKVSTAIHYANLAKIQRDISLMPATKQEAALKDAAEQTQTMLKAGAIVPLSQPSDVLSAQKDLQNAHAKQPWAVYSLAPVHGSDGSLQYAVVQFTKAPIQQDIDFGDGFKAPAGTSGEDVGKMHTAFLAKKMDNDAKNAKTTSAEKIAAGHDATKVKVAQIGADAKMQSDATKGSKATDMVWGTSSDGRQVAGSPDELKAAGVANAVKLPGTEAQKVVVARQLIGPRKGLFDLVNADIDNLAKQGKLGVAASRFGEFMAGKVGNEPDFAALRTHMGLLSTALMQAHVGARGSKDMLEHFKELANYSISNEATLRKAIQSEWEYVNEKAMLPKGNPVDGRSGPGQAQAAPSGSQPIYASAPGKPRMMSTDGGKTWQAAQ